MQDRGECLPAAFVQRQHAFARARDLVSTRSDIGAPRRLQTEPERVVAFPPPLDVHAQAMRRPQCQHGYALALVDDARTQRLRREPPGGAREAAVVTLRIGDKRARQPRRRMIEPLARQGEQVIRARQRARGGVQLPAPRLLIALPTGERAATEAVNLGEKLGAHRHGHLGGGSRSRGALVGGKIDQRHIGLMSNRRDERDQALGHGPHHDFLVE